MAVESRKTSQKFPLEAGKRTHTVTKSDYRRNALRAYKQADRLRAKVKRACTFLNSEGFTIVRDGRQLGNTLFIEVKYPVRSSGSEYEQYQHGKVKLARRCLKMVGLHNATLIPVGYHLSIAIQLPKIPEAPEPKAIGRPPEDDVRKRTQSLREDGCTFRDIAEIIEQETGVTRTPDAYRKLLRRT